MGKTPVLIAEDDMGDQFLVQDAFEKANIINPIYFVDDGRKLLEYLKGCGSYADRNRFPLPGVILLDLNMPYLSGGEALVKIKDDDDLKHLPVVVMTTSDDEGEILRCYRSGASGFITKPKVFNNLVDAMKAFSNYWLDVVSLPVVGES